jgi:preprotein translocase SecE subunit
MVDLFYGPYYHGGVKARRAFLIGNRPAMNALVTYLKHVREEFSHIVWPTTRRALAHTLVVIFIAAVIAVWVGILDYAFSSAVSRIVGA